MLNLQVFISGKEARLQVADRTILGGQTKQLDTES